MELQGKQRQPESKIFYSDSSSSRDISPEHQGTSIQAYALVEVVAVSGVDMLLASSDEPPSFSMVVKLEGTRFGGTTGSMQVDRSGKLLVARAFVLRLDDSSTDISLTRNVTLMLMRNKSEIARGSLDLQVDLITSEISVILNLDWMIPRKTLEDLGINFMSNPTIELVYFTSSHNPLSIETLIPNSNPKPISEDGLSKKLYLQILDVRGSISPREKENIGPSCSFHFFDQGPRLSTPSVSKRSPLKWNSLFFANFDKVQGRKTSFNLVYETSASRQILGSCFFEMSASDDIAYTKEWKEKSLAITRDGKDSGARLRIKYLVVPQISKESATDSAADKFGLSYPEVPVSSDRNLPSTSSFFSSLSLSRQSVATAILSTLTISLLAYLTFRTKPRKD